MKKLLVLAMMATLLMAGSAFAVNRTGLSNNLTPVPNATFQFGAPGIASGPTTTNNDDSCDIGVAPAATLLLPYFEVDLVNRTTNTLFTITNVSRLPQIAHVTLWTDQSFAILDFNIYLTGYDVQAISMADVLISGLVAQPQGTGPTGAQSPIGALSAGAGTTPTNGSYSVALNPNFLQSGIGCGTLPGLIPQSLMALVRSALTTGVYGSCATAGRVHTNAIGYATIDVAASCTTALPSDGSGTYFGVAGGILYDNVLIGDYQQLGPAAAGTVASSFDGAGNAMVHIRAVPEGGPAQSANAPAATNLPYTFYDRYTVNTLGFPRTVDRRQPLPATWAARWIQGGTGAFATNFKIWREGVTITGCSAFTANGALPVAEVVRFDEHENPYVGATNVNCSPNCGPGTITLPETSATNTADTTIYPPMTGADVGGWMYLNLNNGGSANYSVTRANVSQAGGASNLGAPRPSQNWTIVEMFGNVGSSRLSVDFDAAWLGNGCSAATGTSTANGGVAIIGPAGGVLVCPAGNTVCTPGAAGYTGTNTTPLP
ncbi:MAG: hypothetical protein QOC81_4918 [Thermoanaerobaculia bacterium]|jgi:hypothetical protein|nr:hypothetical protein [Thermoanaerobaculia bacterium]